MSILTALADAYERLPDAAPFGYSSEKIGFCISLNDDGSVAHVIDLRDSSTPKKPPRQMLVPQPIKRTVAIAPNTFWDKTSYVLGVTAGDGKRTAQEHQAFVRHHRNLMEGTNDAGLVALLRFLASWTPEQFIAPDWPDDMKDQNVVFTLESERLQSVWLHDRPAAQDVWARSLEADGGAEQMCLVSGQRGPVARLHPAIKGVFGGQSSGTSLVSFNLDAFTSYGHEQGDNAPVSERAASAYTTALNAFLARGSGHRLQIGDTSTVFWAEASDPGAASEAENFFAAYVDPAADEAAASKEIGIRLERIRRGDPLVEIDKGLAEDVRFRVLGLAPNAARLSVRFYFDNTFGRLTENYQKFIADMRIDPPPRDGYPPLWRYLRETAVLGKSENVLPSLAGDWMRAILSGTRYPSTLLTAVLMRLRADGHVNALRAGILKAVLTRNSRTEAPMALDPNCTNRGYLLGRLFATYERVQTAALGTDVNATIRDKFYGSASAQPGKVFALLDRGSGNHLSKLGKQAPGYRVNLEKVIAGIMDAMSPDGDPFPTSLNTEEQALFGLGYYHQRNAFFKKADETEDTMETAG